MLNSNAPAVTFLDNMKSQFQNDQPGRYSIFLDIMKDFRSNRIDTGEVLVRVCGVLNGYPELVRGFNSFLPPGYELEPSESESAPTSITINTPAGVSVYPRDYRQTGNVPPRFLKSHYY